MNQVDVVVVTHNSAAVVGDLLDSLPGALAGMQARVVVVDNGSSDETVALLCDRDDCLLVESDNRGYSAGINHGVRALDGRGPILVLNPDVRLLPGAVPALVRALEVPGTGIAAPKVLDHDGAVSASLRREPTLLRALGLAGTGRPALSEHVAVGAAYDRPGVADWALGAVLLVSRGCHEQLDGWDESFFLYSEETDLCLRARDAGLLTRYVPNAVAVHLGGASGQSDFTHQLQILNRVRLFVRRNGRARGWLFYALTLASEATWVARGHRQSRAAIRALLRPRLRPHVLGPGEGLLPD